MYTLKVENNNGEVKNLSTSPDYTVIKIDGLTPPRATVNSSANATSDGSTINSVRVESRNIVIYCVVERDIEANRIKLYKYFPLKKTVKLYFKNGSRDVYIEGTVELIECDLFSNRQIAQISLICAKPYFKDVEILTSTFADVSALFEFPFSIPSAGIEFSSLTANQRQSIINTGDIDTGVIIDIYAHDEVVNPIIYKVMQSEHMAFNITLNAGDELIVNTNIGEKSVKLIRNGVETNALGYMTPDSNWFVLESGDNVFTYNADSGLTDLQITFSTSLLYGGV